EATERLLAPRPEIDLERVGKASLWLGGDPGASRPLRRVPAEGATEGMLVGLNRGAAPNLLAAPGSIESIGGLVGGGGRLILNSGLAHELAMIDERADGPRTLTFRSGR